MAYKLKSQNTFINGWQPGQPAAMDKLSVECDCSLYVLSGQHSIHVHVREHQLQYIYNLFCVETEHDWVKDTVVLSPCSGSLLYTAAAPAPDCPAPALPGSSAPPCPAASGSPHLHTELHLRTMASKIRLYILKVWKESKLYDRIYNLIIFLYRLTPV